MKHVRAPEFYRSHVRYMRMNFQNLIETRLPLLVHGTSWLANFFKLLPSRQLVPMKLTMKRNRESKMEISRFIGEHENELFFSFLFFFLIILDGAVETMFNKYWQMFDIYIYLIIFVRYKLLNVY